MAFEDRIRQTAADVEVRLRSLMDIAEAGGRAASGASSDSLPPARLAAAMSHALLGGGKRFRPFLVIETAGLFGVAPAAALDCAAALECVHCYSLVHDDLPAMDNDDMRRGRPSVHKAFDEWTAILAGDALLTLAFEVLAQDATHADPAIRTNLVLALARASGWAGMAGGQQLDLDAEKTADVTSGSIDDVVRIQAMKTGALIRFACEAGAILGQASAAQRQALIRYGDQLGRAFQIADDLLDVEGSSVDMGKAVGKDQAAGKATLVSLMGIGKARATLAHVEAGAIAALDPFGAPAETLREAARFVSRRTS